jgi:primosomal protein N' (replication factor Y)
VSNEVHPNRPVEGSLGPIARVRVDLGVMHLDRDFDYLVPEEWHERAVPGARVRVRFSGRLRDAYVIDRIDKADVDSPKPLERVIDAVPPLSPETLTLIQDVADRYVGTFWDVARSAVPTRHARAESSVLRKVAESDAAPAHATSSEQDTSAHPAADPAWRHYRWPEKASPARVVWSSAPASETVAEIVSLARWKRSEGRGVIIVVPDAADVARVRSELATVMSESDVAELSADVGPERRYREFLRVRTGQATVVIGTRTAVFAPVEDLGAIIMWDDGNDVYRELHAPYWDAREVAAMRSHQTSCDVFVGAPARSVATQWWCRSGWAASVDPKRPSWWNVRCIDEHERARDPAAESARIPSAAWMTARNGLRHGPVLFLVARRGYVPALACQDCRAPACCRDDSCQGALEMSSGHAAARCGRCGALNGAWTCAQCGGSRLRAVHIGAGRTADELGRAFPSVPIVWSEADRIVRSVPDTPSLIVATPGAEPIAEKGYRAVIILDARSVYPSLAGAEQQVRRWFEASRLVAKGGEVCLVASASSLEAQALVRWDSRWFAERQLDERASAGLPPVTRVAEVTGPQVAVQAMGDRISSDHRILGPVPVPDSHHVRSYLVVARTQAAAFTRELGSLMRTESTKDSTTRDFRVRMDPRDM